MDRQTTAWKTANGIEIISHSEIAFSTSAILIFQEIRYKPQVKKLNNKTSIGSTLNSGILFVLFNVH